MLTPKQTKYRKTFKSFPSTLKYSNNKLYFGSQGMVALGNSRVSSAQLEASRRAITRKIKRRGKLWINLFPHIPVTSKPTEVRMGKGKGAVSYYGFFTQPGRIIFELDGVLKELARQALDLGSEKLACRTKFILHNTFLLET